MKKLNLLLSATCLLTFLFISSISNAQTSKHEIGLQLAGFNDFNFIYKKQLKKETTYLRVRHTYLDLDFDNRAYNDSNLDQYKSFGFTVGASVGWEFRLPITEKFGFYHGPEIGLSTGYSTILDTNSYSMNITPRFGYVFGFNYNLGKRFVIGLETIPSVSTVLRSSNGQLDNNWNLGFGFQQNLALLSFVYKFETERKKKKIKE